MPVFCCFLILLAMDEQTQINELRNTMYYSMNYIVSLRLFYTAVVLSLVNTSFYSLVGLGRAILSVGVVEFQVCWSLRSLLHTFITDGITISALRVLVQYGYYFLQRSCDYYRKQRFYFFEYIPLGIQIATMIVCFVALFTLVGRMEEKDAYTFAY